MKKPATQNRERKSLVPEPELKARKEVPEPAPMSIFELAASFWDAGRDYPTERRA